MNDEILAQIVSTIVRVTSPNQIILFGSHARGDAGRKSDAGFPGSAHSETHDS